METSKLEIVNQTLSNNRVDSNTEPQLISGADMLSLDDAKTLDKSPEYQRPYTKLDGTKGYTGDEWQKALIVAFLTGKFIQPIHHRYNPNKKKWEIVDGGHRTRTILNFFKGMLKTPTGFDFEYEGKVYKLGNMTWTQIKFDEPILAKFLANNNYFFVVRHYNLTDKEARSLFITLNNLNIVTAAERRNAYNAEIAKLCRRYGSVDSSSYRIFNQYSGGKMSLISLKAVKRETDAFVTQLTYQIYLGSAWEEGSNDAWNNLYKKDEVSSEAGLSEFKLDGAIAKEVKSNLKTLNDMIVSFVSAKGFGKSYWTAHRMLKYCMFFRWLQSQYPKKEITIDYKKFVNAFDKAVSGVKVKHKPYQRYEIKNGKVVIRKGTESTDVDALEYSANKVFGGGTRIDDYEFILKYVESKFNLDSFGVTIGEIRGKFNEDDVLVAWAEQDYKCAGCGKEITRGEIEADHILPVKGNGKTAKDNLQILCDDCNGDKSSGMTFNELEEVIKKKSGRLTAEQIKKIGQVLSI
jgi:hypothetical protein